MRLYLPFSRHWLLTIFKNNSGVLLLFISALISQGCQNKSDPNLSHSDTTAQAFKKEGVKADRALTFKILFIRNYKTVKDSNQLEMLMRDPNKKPQKLVFQFFHTNLNLLTLAGYAGKQNHKDFDKFPFMPILEISKQEPAIKIDITGKNVFFSDQEISEEKIEGVNPLDRLDQLVNAKDFEYITFTPRLATALDLTRFYLVYDLGAWKKDDFDKAFKRVPTSIGVSMNPSPPRNGY